jgi:hypothetical protein
MNAVELQNRLQLSPDNPWPGLQSFDEASRSYFFGMRAQTDALFRLVRRETLALFYGRSGLGKTSLLQAGLFPRLREGNLLPVPVRLDYGVKALPFARQVGQAVAGALSEAGIDSRPPVEGESLWEYFHSSDVDFWDTENRLVKLVLVFDQFEERFTLGRQSPETNAQAELFLTELSQLVENRPPPALKARFEAHSAGVGNYDFDKNSCNVILSLREDFLPELENLRDRFPSILENTLRLQGMTEAQAIEVVLGPGSHLVSEQVATEIVRFAGGADERAQDHFTVEPVLLSVVLYGLNQRRRESCLTNITSELLSGNREQILEGFYEDALRDLPMQARLLVEDGLLTSSGRRDTLAWEDALVEYGVDEKALLTLIDRHLLRREDRSDGARIELVHDRLAEVVRKQRDFRRERESKARELAELRARQKELEREKEIQRRKSRRLLFVCVVLALFGLLLSGYLVWDRYQHRWRHEAYFSNFTQRFGVYEGIGPLNREQVSRRSSSFRFIRRGASGRLVRVEAVDSAGRLTHRVSAGTYLKFKSPNNVFTMLGSDENPARDCQWEIVQDEGGRIAYQLAYDKNKNLVWGFAYSPSLRQNLQKVGHFVGSNGLPSPQTASAAEYIHIDYWPDGLEKQISYFDRRGHPRIGTDGAYAIRMDYDSLGLVKRAMAMDAQGKPMLDKKGVAITEYTRDERGNLTEERVFDVNGKPTLTKSGWHRATLTYDQFGNTIGGAYFDAAGDPCVSKEGFAKALFKYNAHGNKTEIEYLDANGQLCINQQNGFARETDNFDERGNLIEAACFDPNGHMCACKYGNSRTINKFDERGNMIESDCFDTSGKPCLTTEGVAKATMRYDDRSNMIAAEWYGLDGKPCLSKGGCAKVTNDYDERGNCVTWKYYGVDGYPCLTKEGYAGVTAEYDESGNQAIWACFGVDGKPAIDRSDGYHLVKKSYDERGNCINWEYFDTDGQRCLTKQGYASVMAKYNARDNQVSWACFGLDGKPAIDRSIGAHSIKKFYDARGNRVALEYYGVDGQRSLTKDGYSRLVADYDQRGNEVEWSCFGLDGKPAINRSVGCHAVKKSYDARGNEIGESYLGVEGKPLRNNDGVAGLTQSYDERGNVIAGANLDEGGRPMRDNDGIALFRDKYDERDNRIEVATYDEDGKPVQRNEGYAQFTASYDERGNQIAQAYFDEHGKPVRDNEGFARFTAVYDERGNQIEVATFNQEGKPAQRNEGYARFTASYDERGNQIAWAYFDEHGKPVRDNEGFARCTADYDKNNNCIRIEYYDVDGKPCLSKDGFTKANGKFDENGHVTQQVLFDLSGKSTLKNYDARGNEIEETYLDETGRPAVNQYGIARWTAKYSESNDAADQTYFDQAGKPTAVEVYLVEILPDGQAKKAGLAAGDVLISYDGKAVRNEAELITWIKRPGNGPRELLVLRGQLRLTFGMQPGRLGVRWQARAVASPSLILGNATNR